MKLFIDDIREPPDKTWLVARTYKQAEEYILSGLVEEVSFDHDLGEEKTGYDLAKLFERASFYGKEPPVWRVHSANPVGRSNINIAMRSAERMYDAKQRERS